MLFRQERHEGYVAYPFSHISPLVLFEGHEARQRAADAILDGVHAQLREVTLKYGQFFGDLRFLIIYGVRVPGDQETDVILILGETGDNNGLALRLTAFGETIRFDSDPGAKIYRDTKICSGRQKVDTVSILAGKVTIDGARAVEKVAEQIGKLCPPLTSNSRC